MQPLQSVSYVLSGFLHVIQLSLQPTTSSLLVEWQHPDVGPVDRYYVTYNASEDIDIEFEVNGSQNT